MKVFVVCPAATVTVCGTVAFRVSLLRNVTDKPPAGAAPLNVIVPVELVGAVTVVGFSVSETKAPAICVVAEAEFDLAD